ncbi:hypothetical protein GOP47_0002022 [Adiantum capillus-veneris]|uniref:VTT domain-containing protein n=1 Tax=Adiantum capillus-veneris TaxID=13818 RepID=A0A9D4VA29_ADICA|nr:hypothetical protein GOP47_0002022 [Adiantum capillus-veneris]
MSLCGAQKEAAGSRIEKRVSPPTMEDIDPQALKIPKNLADLQIMKEHLSVYTKDYTLQVLIGYVAVYIFMQTFMIPGTIFFSLLAGALFGIYKGILLVIFSATAGASTCYFLSKMFGAPIAVWLWPQQIGFFRAEVAKRKGKLLNYMLFLRVTPTLPNTFINFASPIVNIPYHIFFLATVFGLVPASFLSVRAGLTLGQLESLGDLYDTKTVISLFVIGLLFILPTVLSRQPEKRVPS